MSILKNIKHNFRELKLALGIGYDKLSNREILIRMGHNPDFFGCGGNRIRVPRKTPREPATQTLKEVYFFFAIELPDDLIKEFTDKISLFDKTGYDSVSVISSKAKLVLPSACSKVLDGILIKYTNYKIPICPTHESNILALEATKAMLGNLKAAVLCFRDSYECNEIGYICEGL